jgi:cell division transport system permease protein
MSSTRSSLKPKPNYLATIISVSLVLFLVGMFSFISLHANVLGDYFKERINVIAELKPRTTQKEIDRLLEQFGTYATIKQSSIRHIDQDEAASLLSQEFGEDILMSDMPSPLYDVITFNVVSEALNKESLEELKTDLKRKYSAVNDIYYQETLIETVIENIQRISLFILILSGIIGVITMFLIFNAIKLALYSNRVLIKNMEMVGASRAFIRKPFMIKATVHGLISGIVAVLLLFLLIYYLIRQQPEILEIMNREYLMIIAVSVILSGIIITVLSTLIVVSSYLRKSIDELF